MAKKKSAQAQETTETPVVEEALDKESTGEAVSSAEDSEPAPNPALLMTGIVNLDEAFEDPDVLDRLRSSLLSMSAIYREAQHFAAQSLNVSALMCGGDPVLARNTAEILRICDIWDSSAMCGLILDDADSDASIERYLLNSLRIGLVDPASYARDLAAISDKLEPAKRTDIVLKSIVEIGNTEEAGENSANVLQAVIKLCTLLELRDVQKLFFDASSTIRIASLKSLLTKTEIPASVLSIALILFREKNDAVTIAVLRVIAKFTPFPELAIPAMLDILSTSSDDVANEIYDALRGYGDDAVRIVMDALGDTDDNAVKAAKMVIEKSPQRYTDPLLKAMKSRRTRDHVRAQVISILKTHPDDARQEEIMKEVDSQLNPPKYERPEWVAPVTEIKFLEKACDNADVYKKLLDDSEVQSLKSAFDEETLARLLNDANEMVQRNALHIIKASGKASPALVFGMTVWFKSNSIDLVSDAIETYLAFEPDRPTALKTLLHSFSHLATDDARDYIFHVVMREQAMIDAMMDLYFAHPVACTVFVKKFLRNNPSEKTIKTFLSCLDRDKTFDCVEASIAILLAVNFEFDNKKIRKILAEHVSNPMSRGQRGLLLRMDCLKLLRNYMTADKSVDKTTVSALQNIYKTIKNSELQKMSRELLLDLDQEVFDDEEDDDFDDLKGDDE